MINNKKIGKQLKDLRTARGWKQCEVAEKTNLSRPAISNIESGKRALTLKTLKKFCEVYSIDISYFGIETDNFDNATDLLSRIKATFDDDGLTDKEKDELYLEIMRYYLDSVNSRVAKASN